MARKAGSRNSLHAGLPEADIRSQRPGSYKASQHPEQKTYDGDLLEKNSQLFTQEKPFTPKTLKSDKSSYLSKYRYYRAPLKKPAQGHTQSKVMEQDKDNGKYGWHTSVTHAAAVWIDWNIFIFFCLYIARKEQTSHVRWVWFVSMSLCCFSQRLWRWWIFVLKSVLLCRAQSRSGQRMSSVAPTSSKQARTLKQTRAGTIIYLTLLIYLTLHPGKIWKISFTVTFNVYLIIFV